METKMPEMMTVKELAQLIRTKESSIRKMVQYRQIPFYKPFGTILFDKEEIMTIIVESRQDSIVL